MIAPSRRPPVACHFCPHSASRQGIELRVGYVTRRVTELGGYSESLGSAVGFEKHRERLSSLKLLGIVYAVLSIFILLVLGGSGGTVPAGGLVPILVVVLAAPYTVFTAATLVWTFSYSMYVVHHLGSQQMTLLSFAEDRTLGLRPFGLTAFHLTLVYVGASIVLVVSLNIPPLPIQFSLALLSFFFIAIPLFLLPLRTLRRQLISAKSREREWITKRYV